MLTSSRLRQIFAVLAASLYLALHAGPAAAMATGEGDGVLKVGAVQFAISPELYIEPENLRKAVNDVLDLLEKAAAVTGGGLPLDLAVFPEYTSAFLGMAYLSADEIATLRADPAACRDIIVRAVRSAEPDVHALWTAVAQDRGYAILAGTTLVVDEDGGIRNRALLYDPAVGLSWTQDKAFPGAAEERILDLATGGPEDARTFTIDGSSLAVTICRDTYNSVWEDVLPEAELWIDIKANELPYTREYYDEALPSRLRESPIDKGLTVSLAGGMLGYRFTGVTEYLSDDSILAGTGPLSPNALLVIRLPKNGN